MTTGSQSRPGMATPFHDSAAHDGFVSAFDCRVGNSSLSFQFLKARNVRRVRRNQPKDIGEPLLASFTLKVAIFILGLSGPNPRDRSQQVRPLVIFISMSHEGGRSRCITVA